MSDASTTTTTNELPNPFLVTFDALRAAARNKEQPPHSRKRPRTTSHVLPATTLSTIEQSGNTDDSMYSASKFGGFGDYMHNKRRKLQAQNQYLVQDGGSLKPQIFSKISIYVNGETSPSAFALRELILEHGGMFHEHLDRKSMVTHIITSNLTRQKFKEFQNMKVVKPEWLVESAKAGRLLRWSDFRFEAMPRVEGTQGLQTSQTNLVSSRSKGVSAALATGSLHVPHPSGATSSSVPAKRENLSGSTDEARTQGPGMQSALNIGENNTECAAIATAEPSPIYATDPVAITGAVRIPGYAPFVSNPIATRKMEDPAWRAEHTAVKVGFVESYHSNSRLSLLSTFKAELISLVARAQADAESAAFVAHEDDKLGQLKARLVASPSRKGKGKMKQAHRVIMHCDFDCFFVSAGLVNRPHLRGKPVVVCHSRAGGSAESSTSEIASCSYEARAFKVKNGMSLGQAKKLCPSLTTIPYDYDKYKELSLKFYTILMRHADDLQAVSIDEALIDISTIVAQFQEDADDDANVVHVVAQSIQEEVKSATGCTVSIGIADNILLARLATRRAKPAGIFHLRSSEALAFLDTLRVSDLHGFAWSAEAKLEDKFGSDSTRLLEIRGKSKGMLQSVLGEKQGEKLWKAVRGLDDTQLQSNKPRKSVSSEVNYMIRFENNAEFKSLVDDIASDVAKRLQNIDRRGKHLTLKLMTRHPDAPIEAPKFLGHGICDVHNKSYTFHTATDDAVVIAAAAWKLAEAYGFDPKELRGIGIQIQRLEGDDGQSAIQKDNDPGSLKSAFNRIKPSVVEEPRRELQLPSMSQVDRDFWEALPEDIRREYEADLQVQRRSVHDPGPARAPSNEDVIQVPSEVVDISELPTTPTKPKLHGKVKHITKQLGIKSRSAISPRHSNIGKLFQNATVSPKSAPIRKESAPIISAPTREHDVFDIDATESLDKEPPNVTAATGRLLPDVSSRARSVQPLSKVLDERRTSRLSLPPPPAHRARSSTPILAGENTLDAGPSKKLCPIFTRQIQPPKVSDEELRSIGIVEVAAFRCLPADLQHSALQSARREAGVQRSPTKRASHPPSPHKIIRRKGHSTASFQPDPVFERRKRTDVISYTTTNDLQHLLSSWVASECAMGPSVKDVEKFSTYLEACVKQETGSAAMERAVNIMRWWKVLLNRMNEDNKANEKVRGEWWDAWRRVKSRIDDIIRSRFGCPLCLD